MKRIAIIDKENSKLYVEDVEDNVFGKYGSVDDYVKDNYSTRDFTAIVTESCEYIGGDDPDPYDLDEVIDNILDY